MGIGSSTKRPEKEEKKPITANELKNLIKITQERCKLYHNKKADQVRRTEKEIAECLKKNNLDMARAKMDNLLKAEDMIVAYDILLPILEIVSEKCIYIVSNTECPAELRAPLDSIIYAASRAEIEELVQFKDKILQHYGADYISKAENNSDKLVNENLVAKLRVTIFNEAVINIRLKSICLKNKIDPSILGDGVVNVDIPTNTNPVNIYASTQQQFPTQSMIQPNTIQNPYCNSGNNNSGTGYSVNNMYPNFSTSQQGQGSNQGGFPSYPPSNDGFPSQPQNPYDSQPKNPYEGDVFPSQNNTQSFNNSSNNNYQSPPENPNPSYVPPPMVDIMGNTVESTVPITEAPESKEQSQIKSNNQSAVNNPYLTNSTNNNEFVQYQPPQTQNSTQNIGNGNIVDDIMGKTVGQTVDFSQKIPNDPKDPFAPGAKVKDPFDMKTIKESGINSSSNNNNNKKEDEELFGGETVGQTINLSGINPNINNNSKINDKMHITSATMNLSIANPDGKINPYEQNESQSQDPFAPGANVEDPFLVKTLLEKEKKDENQPQDPFAPGAKVKDPFGGSTLKDSGFGNETA